MPVRGRETGGECCLSIRIMQGVNCYTICLCVSPYSYSCEEAEGLRIADSQPRPTSAVFVLEVFDLLVKCGCKFIFYRLEMGDRLVSQASHRQQSVGITVENAEWRVSNFI
jgi:hypothetical protein